MDVLKRMAEQVERLRQAHGDVPLRYEVAADIYAILAATVLKEEAFGPGRPLFDVLRSRKGAAIDLFIDERKAPGEWAPVYSVRR